jgi:hypothetical protein
VYDVVKINLKHNGREEQSDWAELKNKEGKLYCYSQQIDGAFGPKQTSRLYVHG